MVRKIMPILEITPSFQVVLNSAFLEKQLWLLMWREMPLLTALIFTHVVQSSWHLSFPPLESLCCWLLQCSTIYPRNYGVCHFQHWAYWPVAVVWIEDGKAIWLNYVLIVLCEQWRGHLISFLVSLVASSSWRWQFTNNAAPTDIFGCQQCNTKMRQT